jgi:chemotaxis protein CheD
MEPVVSDTAYVGIGCVMTSASPARLWTILGSCVALMIYDTESKRGGMAHILLSGSGEQDNTRYSDRATEQLLDRLGSEAGENARFIAKIAGGARAPSIGESSILRMISGNSILRIMSVLVEREIDIEGMHVGGKRERKLIFDLETGDVIISIKDKMRNLEKILVI